MLKRKVPVKIVRVKLLNDVRQFSLLHLAVFMLAFGVIGYVIYHGFATTTTTTAAWPYSSPFGDKSSGIDANGVSINCYTTKSSSCRGSCFVTNGSTGSCRPMTMETCKDDTTPPSYRTTPTIIPTQIDQGVDYNIDSVVSYCSYSNPNPADTGTGYNSKANSRVYAMGPGTIVCVAANPSAKFHETITLTQRCHGGSIPIGAGEGTWLVYKLNSGPAKGLKIYVAEGCNLSRNAISNVLTGQTKHRRWKRGDAVNANSVLCEISNGTIEMGWANSGTQLSYPNKARIKNAIVPAAFSCFWWHVQPKYGYASTNWGRSMNQFIVKSAGGYFGGYPGSNGVANSNYRSCTSYPVPAKYKNSAWYHT
jgi:hypothetical protein